MEGSHKPDLRQSPAFRRLEQFVTEFWSRTAWSLLNAFTEVGKSRSPHVQMDAGPRLSSASQSALALRALYQGCSPRALRMPAGDREAGRLPESVVRTTEPEPASEGAGRMELRLHSGPTAPGLLDLGGGGEE